MAYPRRGKLTDDQVVTLRVAYARGYKSSFQLAKDYGLSQGAITGVVQGSTYKAAAGPITWPRGQPAISWFNPIAERVRPRQVPFGKVPGHCWDVACKNPIASSGWAQRMHLCERCFTLNGGKRGRQKTGRQVRSTCNACGKPFSYYKTASMARRRTCSVACGAQLSADARRKRPDELSDEYLHELYWGRNLTAADIAKQYGDLFTRDAVILWLIAAGIPRRRPNWRAYSSCMVEGCGADIYKLWNGRQWYGRLCKPHLRARDRRRAAFYQEEMTRQRGIEIAQMIRGFLAGLPDSVKVDVESSVMLAVLSGELAPPLSLEKVKPFIAEGFREYADAYKFLSLAAPVNTDDGVQTWGERLGLA